MTECNWWVSKHESLFSFKPNEPAWGIFLSWDVSTCVSGKKCISQKTGWRPAKNNHCHYQLGDEMWEQWGRMVTSAHLQHFGTTDNIRVKTDLNILSENKVVLLKSLRTTVCRKDMTKHIPDFLKYFYWGKKQQLKHLKQNVIVLRIYIKSNIVKTKKRSRESTVSRTEAAHWLYIFSFAEIHVFQFYLQKDVPSPSVCSPPLSSQ